MVYSSPSTSMMTESVPLQSKSSTIMTTHPNNNQTKKKEDELLLRPFRPLDAVPPFEQNSNSSSALILSISVGNSRMHWACHAGAAQQFAPVVFWRSNIPSGEAAETIGVESLIPQQLHHDFFGSTTSDTTHPTTTATTGQSGNRQRRSKTSSSSDNHNHNHNNNNNSQALAHRTTLRVPTIYVYIVSTSAQHLRVIRHVFRGLPALLFELTADDLLQATTSSTVSGTSNTSNPTITTTENHTSPATKTKTTTMIYQGMGVDRVANIVAARLLYPQATAHLVIDGGTALTYTTVLPETTSTSTSEQTQQPQQPQLAGGIGPGLAISCHALYDFTGDLPFVSYEQLVQTVTRCETQKQPLPTLVPASSNNSSDTSINTTDSLLGCILQARALLLCNVVRGFLKVNTTTTETTNTTTTDSSSAAATTTTTIEQLPVVVLTGGDAEVYGKLLQPHHSYLCESSCESNDQLLQSSVTDEDNIVTPALPAGDAVAAVPPGKTFRLCRVNHLFPHAVRGLLLQAQQTLDEELATVEEEEEEGTEWVRRQMLGQRIAVLPVVPTSGKNRHGTAASRTKKDPTVLGTIVSVTRHADNKLDHDAFGVFYDDVAVATNDLTVPQIYDGLMLFHDTVQKTKMTDDQRSIRILNKAKDAKEAAELLANKCTAAQLRQQQQQQMSQVAGVPTTLAPQPTKKRPAETMAAGAPATKKVAVEVSGSSRPSEISGIALVGRRVAKVFDEGIFFGTIREFLPNGSVEGAPYDLWSVVYDDEDEEDLAHKEIKAMLALYEKEKNNDDAAK